VFEEAEAFNLPLTVTTGSPGPARSFVGVDRPGVGVEAVKEADDGDGLIVRLCELHGSRGPVTVTLGREHGAVGRVDILERPLDDPCPVETLDGGSVRLQLRPFELVTLRFRPPGRA
jgi:alpha-mannosidase